MGLEKLSFITVELRGIGELNPILAKCGSLRLGTRSKLKVLDLVRL